jgi:SAM-dependent methyltransferase
MSKEVFDFKVDDREGKETLDAISKADLFNEWMFKAILPHCKGQILEIGSGIGNISGQFLKVGHQITLSDIRKPYCETLREKFGQYNNLEAVHLLDLIHPDFDEVYENLTGKFDTVFALNVVEHIFDDALAIRNARKLLKADGNLIILVPAYQFLFNGFDRGLEHYRRYTLDSLKKLISSAGFRIERSWYFNFTGIFAWFISGKLMRNNVIPGGQMGLYNKFVPVFKLIDKLVFQKAGLSAIVVGKK